MTVDFKTPGGLKIRLNARYFFCRLIGLSTQEMYHISDEAMCNNEDMVFCVSQVESRCQFYALVRWIISMFFLFFCYDYTVAEYLFITVGACLIADFYTLISPKISKFLFSKIIFFIEHIIYTLLWKIWFIPALILIVTSVIMKNYIFILYYVGACAIYFIIENIIDFITRKCRGFGRDELRAFNVFYENLRIRESLKDFILDYSLKTSAYMDYLKDEHMRNFDEKYKINTQERG